MRKFLHLFVFAALLVSSCSNPMLSALKKDNGQPSSYTVSFDAQNGTAAATVRVSAGAAVSGPVTPIKNGFVFGGWFATASCDGSAISFPYTVSQDITFYAKWTVEATPVTLTYDSNTASLNSVTVNSGTTINAVSTPVNTGYTFAGWYTNDAFTGDPVVFPFTITLDTRLYAKWVSNTVAVTVTFNAQGGSAVQAVSQYPGTTIDSSPASSRTGYTFGGWYTDAACSGSPVSFPYTVTQAATLYAKWTEESSVVPVSGVSLGNNAVTLTAGTATTLAATVLPANATNKAVSWTSGNTSVATVSGGTVSAVAQGTATITVTTADGGYTATCTVTVEPAAVPVTGVSLNKATLALYEGSSETLTATVSPSGATDKSVIWTSTNTAAATVDQSGKVTAVKAGSATIKAKTTDGSFSASCTVTVSAIDIPVTAVTLDYTGLTLKKGKSQVLLASVTPSDASNKSITWTTSDKTVATVSAGTVTAVAAGTATITASSNNGKTATCTVTVPSLASLTVEASAATVYEGGTVSLTATAVYSDNTTATVNPAYAVSDSSIATVEGGIVTGVGAGSAPATITATYTEDGVTKTATVDLAVDFDGIKIKVAQSLGFNQIYYWDLNGDTTKKNTWPGTVMSVSGTDYVYSFSGASAVKLLITKDAAGTKLYDKDMVITAKGVYRVTSTGPKKESWTPPADDMTIYVKAASAPTIWVWEDAGNDVSTNMGYSWPGPTMTAASGLKDNTGWYQFAIPGTKLSGKAIKMKLNSGAELVTAKTATFWYDGTTYYNADPTTPPGPEAPTVSVKPASGNVPLSGSIILSYTDGNDDANLTVTASVNGVAYTRADFTAGQLVVKVSSITQTAGTTIPVSISAENSEGSSGTTSVTLTAADIAPDKFTWDNALVYFVLTDRFYNGNTANDHSYSRVNNSTNSAVPDVATFHGGDIAGLTAKMDYFDQLGVNAIWITAPYEQVHGWVSGKNDAFPHYAYHGYYTLDWTFMDKNMGTVAEFRTFVTEAHKRGIRVVMDVVMNHAGYNTIEDMITYSFGSTSITSHGWVDTGGDWGKNHDVTDYTSSLWSNWWSSWVRGFDGKFGCATPGGDDLTMSLAGLPDVVTEKTGAYDIPVFLKTKWAAEDNSTYDAWRVPAAAGLRKNLGIAPADYLVKWLAAWVEEFGIDGFRCDTAKHVDRYRWGQLKDACNTALAAWRASDRADTVAKNWDEDFWMTGEHFGWSNSISGDYYTTGKFDSMINFAFNSAGGSNGSSSGSTPTTSNWATYANMINNNSDGNNMLSYVSSHDTGLHRPADMKNVATMLCLLPGGVQIYYGDETNRPYAYQSFGDSDMMTRGDMNWTGYDASLLAHWQKVGSFREKHPAVGAGIQTEIEANTYGRSYSGGAGDDKVVIKLATGSVKVSGFFADGTLVRNAYDGTTVTVSGGYAPFTSATTPILVELAE